MRLYYLYKSSLGPLGLMSRQWHDSQTVTDVEILGDRLHFDTPCGVHVIHLDDWPRFCRVAFATEEIGFETIDDMLLFVKADNIGRSL